MKFDDVTYVKQKASKIFGWTGIELPICTSLNNDKVIIDARALSTARAHTFMISMARLLRRNRKIWDVSMYVNEEKYRREIYVSKREEQ